MRAQDRPARSRRGYRLLLRALPQSFRERYGAAMEETFSTAEANARGAGSRALMALYRRELRDVLSTGVRLRLAGRRASVGGPGPWGPGGNLYVFGSMRHVLRSLLRHPGHGSACVATLALAVAAATASFGVVKQAFFDGLPFIHGEDLVAVYTRTETWPDAPVSAHVLEELRASDAPLTAYVPMDPTAVLYSTPGATEQVSGLLVSEEFFHIIDPPALGRHWTRGERNVVVVTHRFWQNVLEAVPEVVGRQITLDGVAHVVVGVLPASFVPPFFTGADVFLPIDMAALLATAPRARLDFTVLARRAPGVPQERLAAYLDAFSERQRVQHPADHARQHWWAEPLRNSLLSDARPALAGTGAAAVLLLLIVCANIAGVSAARAVGLRRMLAVQSALGATRPRLLLERLIEGFVLASAGSIIGVWSGFLLFRTVATFQPQFLPRMPPLHLGIEVVLIALAAGILTGTVAAAAPFSAVISGRLDASGSARGSTGTVSLSVLRSGLVVAQVAVALVLVVGAGLLVRTVKYLSEASLGYRTDRLYTVQVNLPAERYAAPGAAIEFETIALQRLSALPQVAAATASVGVPVIGGGRASLIVQGRPANERHEVAYFAVAPDFMRVMQVPLRSGRPFGVEDRMGAPRVVLINEMTARQVWPDGNAVGARIHIGPEPPAADSAWTTVVGVVADVRQHGPTEAILPTLYSSTHQLSWPSRRFNFIVTQGVTPPSASELRAVFHELDAGAAVGVTQALTQLIADRTAPQRLVMLALVTLGVVATALSVFGLYAVVSLTSSLRVREYAIRMAVGAEPRRVRWLVLRQAIGLSLLGIAAGLGVAFAATRALQGLLHGVTPLDAATFAGAVSLVLALAIFSAWLPAARSGRISAAQALRS